MTNMCHVVEEILKQTKISKHCNGDKNFKSLSVVVLIFDLVEKIGKLNSTTGMIFEVTFKEDIHQ